MLQNMPNREEQVPYAFTHKCNVKKYHGSRELNGSYQEWENRRKGQMETG